MAYEDDIPNELNTGEEYEEKVLYAFIAAREKVIILNGFTNYFDSRSSRKYSVVDKSKVYVHTHNYNESYMGSQSMTTVYKVELI